MAIILRYFTEFSSFGCTYATMVAVRPHCVRDKM